MTTDPVCGMQVDEKTTQWKADYNGRTFYFCSTQCRDKFKAAIDHFEKALAERDAPLLAKGFE